MEIPVMGVSYTVNRNIQSMEVPDIEYSNADPPNINDLTAEDLLKYFDLEEIELAKLKSKFEHYAIIKYMINYEQDCVEFLHDYLLMYMKKFLRHMAQQSRAFKIDCPLLTRTKTIETDPSETEKPWEMQVMWNRLTPKKIEAMKKNDEEEKKLELMKKSSSRGTGIQLKKSILDYKLNTEITHREEKVEKNTENPFLDNQILLGSSPYMVTTSGNNSLKITVFDDTISSNKGKYGKYKLPVGIKRLNRNRASNVLKYGKVIHNRSFQSAIQVPSSLPGPSRYRWRESKRKKSKEDGEKNKKINTRFTKDAVKYEVVQYNFKVEDFLELIEDGCPLILSKEIQARLEDAALKIKSKPSFWKQEQTVKDEEEKEEKEKEEKSDGIEVITLDYSRYRNLTYK